VCLPEVTESLLLRVDSACHHRIIKLELGNRPRFVVWNEEHKVNLVNSRLRQHDMALFFLRGMVDLD
jgi:hypothetical protein